MWTVKKFVQFVCCLEFVGEIFRTKVRTHVFNRLRDPVGRTRGRYSRDWSKLRPRHSAYGLPASRSGSLEPGPASVSGMPVLIGFIPHHAGKRYRQPLRQVRNHSTAQSCVSASHQTVSAPNV